MNKLYYGDNLDVLRDHIKDESVDLIYLDPPFNSQRDYNLLFKSAAGGKSDAQTVAFKDTWVWGEQAEREYSEILRSTYTDTAEMIRSMRRFLGENDMMAYLVMITRRLMELHRALKPTGTLFLHCDTTASHYIRFALDTVFGKTRFLNEISWERSSPKNNATKRISHCRDLILWYAKGDTWTWNPQFRGYDESYLKKSYRHVEEGTGRRYRLGDVTNPNKNRPNLKYEWKGVTRVWRWTRDKMEEMDKAGRLIYSKNGIPSYKRYLDEMPGMPVTDNWTDISPLQGGSKEWLGYPTQKPRTLLERIIRMASNPGDVVLDPFCGCGTAVHAAEKLERMWIGIDITHLAISLIEKRLLDAFPNIQFKVEGTPEDLEGARDLFRRDAYQFQWWACSLVNAQPYQSGKKGADKGIDGLIFPKDVVNQKITDYKIIVSVKGGENVGVAMIRELIQVMKKNDAEIALFVTLNEPTQPMRTEAASAGFYRAGNGQEYPRVQILTIEDLLLKHKRPEYIDLSHGAETFKKAQTEKSNVEQPILF